MRSRVGPVLSLGLLAGVLSAVAGTKPWAAGLGANADRVPATSTAGQMPVAGALALVVLACWGVLLVTRGRVRRLVAVLGVVAALGVVVSVLIGFGSVPDAVAQAYGAAGYADQAYATAGYADVEVSRTGWYWVAAVASVLSVVATGLAVAGAPSWPEMSRRYDAPVDTPTPADADATPLELWRALDEGRDPTA